MINTLDLFSGTGGFSLGLELTGGFRTAAFCEYDKDCQEILRLRWPDTQIYNDIKELTYQRLIDDGHDNIGLICGGYPCQPFSHAGKRLGQEDDRHLWPEIKRLLRESSVLGQPVPRVIFENVAGHINMGLDDVLSDLESEGYTGRAYVIPAAAVGAKHRRDRVWIVAHAKSKRLREARELERRSTARVTGAGSAHPANPNSDGRDTHDQREGSSEGSPLSATESSGQQRSSGDGGSNQDPGRVESEGVTESGREGRDMANTINEGSQGRVHRGQDQEREDIDGHSGRGGSGSEQQGSKASSIESRLGGASYGLSGWMDGSWEQGITRVTTRKEFRARRLKQMGNAVVPAIPQILGATMLAVEEELYG